MTVPTPTYTDGNWGYDTFTEDGTTYARVVSYSGTGGSGVTITIPNTLGGYVVKEVGKGGSQETLWNNSTMTSNTILGPIPSTVTAINNYAFYNGVRVNMNLGAILPKNLVTIGDYAFGNGQTYSGDLILPDTVTTIGQYAFQNGGYTSIVIPAGIQSIGASAFYICRNVTNVKFKCMSAPTLGSRCFGLNSDSPSSTTKVYPVQSPNNWASSVLNSYKNTKTAFTYSALPVFEHLMLRGNKIQVDSAIRDEDGLRIKTNYALKSETGGAYQLTDVQAVFSLQSTPDYPEFPYCAVINEEGITPNTFANVVYSNEQSTSMKYMPTAISDTGCIKLYANQNVGTQTIPTISVGQEYVDLDSSQPISSPIETRNLTLISSTDTEYTGFPYKYSFPCVGATVTRTADVTFDVSDATSGNFAPVCETGAGVIYIWARGSQSSANIGYMLYYTENATVVSGTVGSDIKPIKIVNGQAVAVANNLVDVNSNQEITGLKTMKSPVSFKGNGMDLTSNTQAFGFSDINFVDDQGRTVGLLRFLQQNTIIALQFIGFNKSGQEAYWNTFAQFTRS